MFRASKHNFSTFPFTGVPLTEAVEMSVTSFPSSDSFAVNINPYPANVENMVSS